MAESKVIKKIANDSCVIIGRCVDYILRNKDNIYNIFLYSDKKEQRVIKYYRIKKNEAKKLLKKSIKNDLNIINSILIVIIKFTNHWLAFLNII